MSQQSSPILQSEVINAAVREHQLAATTDWKHQPQLKRLHEFFCIFNDALFASQPLPLPVISVESERLTTLGHYRIGRNGLGLVHNINLNAEHIESQSLLEQLITLVHEMVHQWQHIYGNPGKTSAYHNKEWCQMVTSTGIVSVPPAGHTIRIEQPFLDICRQHSVTDSLPDLDAAPIGCSRRTRRGEGRSTLKKWSCRCEPPQSVWSGRAKLTLVCPSCDSTVKRGS